MFSKFTNTPGLDDLLKKKSYFLQYVKNRTTSILLFLGSRNGFDTVLKVLLSV